MVRKKLRARDIAMAKKLATDLNTLEKKRAQIYKIKKYPYLTVNSCKFDKVDMFGDRIYSFKKTTRKTG